MFIDIHAPAYRKPCPFPNRFATPEELIPRYDEMGIERAGYPGYPVKEQGAAPKLFRRYPNMYGDLSAGSGYNALARDAEHAVRFINESQDRLLFGADICTPEQGAPLAAFLIDLRDTGRISAETFERIARGNAIRLLGL